MAGVFEIIGFEKKESANYASHLIRSHLHEGDFTIIISSGKDIAKRHGSVFPFFKIVYDESKSLKMAKKAVRRLSRITGKKFHVECLRVQIIHVTC